MTILSALAVAVCALGWSAVMAQMVRLMRAHGAETPPATIRSSAAAVWFAPAAILLLQGSPVGLAAGLLMVVIATRLLYAPPPAMDGETAPPSMPGAAAMLDYGELPLDLLSRWLILSLMIAAGWELAILCVLMHHPLPAAGLLAMSAAVLTSTAIGAGAWPENRPPNALRSIAALGLTVLLAVSAGWVTSWRGSRGSWSPGWFPAMPKTLVSGGSKTGVKEPKPPMRNDINVPGSYPGVILWPEIKAVTALVAPQPVGLGAFPSPLHPLTIPFGGEYWMFRWPFARPPQNSYFQRGTPASLSFKTTDHARLQMEARQKLEQPISLRCCSRLQVAILNADPDPSSVWLELLLIDGALPGPASQSLGLAPVNSVPDLKADRKAQVAETLDYKFPASPRLEQFDEIKAVFHLMLGRMDKSARISIERFVLVP